MTRKTVAILSILLLILPPIMRFTGLFSENFENLAKPNCYSTYKLLAKSLIRNEIRAIIIIPERKIRIIKVYRKAIGAHGASGKCIDTEGVLFVANTAGLIEIEGDYSRWPGYYKTLNKTYLLDKIYYVNIKKHSLDIWLIPGVLVQIVDITILQEFIEKFPVFFKKNNRIDLRNTKRIGVSEMDWENK